MSLEQEYESLIGATVRFRWTGIPLTSRNRIAELIYQIHCTRGNQQPRKWQDMEEYVRHNYLLRAKARHAKARSTHKKGTQP